MFASLFWRSVIFVDKVIESAAIEGLTHDINHAYLEAVAQGFIVYVGCHGGHDSGNRIVTPTSKLILHPLINLALLVIKDADCGLEAVNNGHIEIHEDELELGLAACLLPVGDKDVDSFLATQGLFTHDAEVAEEDLEWDQVEGIVVHDQGCRLTFTPIRPWISLVFVFLLAVADLLN